MVFNIRLVCVNDERRKVLPRITLGRHVGGAVASLVLNFEIRRRRDEPRSTRKNAETGKGHGEEKLKVEMKRTKKRLAQGASEGGVSEKKKRKILNRERREIARRREEVLARRRRGAEKKS